MKHLISILFIILWTVPIFSSNDSNLNKNDWQGQWIGLDRVFPWDVETANSRLSARFLRKEFSSAKTVESAKAYIIGLGLYELYVNGEKIGDHVLTPGPTDYDKTVFYNVWDVTQNIVSGKNTLGVILGTGHYYNNRQNTRPEKHKIFGYPKLLFQLEIEYTDGSKQTIVSDQTWKITSDGPIRSTNTFDGERYDATKELDGWNKVGYKDNKWLKPDVVSAPKGKITKQLNPNMKIMKVIKPVSITHLAADTFIMDMGQNMVGWLEMTVRGGKRGDQIVKRHAEILNKTGRVNTANLRTAQQTVTYTKKGAGVETWEPRFTTQGFRFVEITGFPGTPTVNDFLGKVIYDDIETIGNFESSNSLLDQIVKNAWWGIAGNYKGVPLDCPQRDERQAWLGDHTIGCFSQSFLFDNEKLYIKWLNDIRDAQTETGQIPDICPPYYMTYYSDNMTWPGAYIFVAQMIYHQFGNPDPIKEHYPTMKKWLTHMKKYMTSEYIITQDKYGDWCVPPESPELIRSNDPARLTDGKLIATAYYYKMLQVMQQFAVIADQRQDIPEYAALTENMRAGFNKTFYNPESGQYSNNTVTANLLPLAFGIVEKANEDRVFKNIIDRIVRDKMHISTGIVGTSWLMRELTKHDRADIAYTIATQRTYPSWGYMVENGATTFWELWNGNTANPRMNSHNHIMMLGDLLVWIFEDLAGIKTHRNHPGFKQLWMKPHPTEDLTFVKASYKTQNGLVKSEWELKDNIFTWKITIPEGMKANILVPAASLNDIQENGRPVMQVSGLKYVRIEEKRINLEIGSGDYVFTCPYGEAQNRWKAGVISEMFVNKNDPYPESHAATIAQTTDGTMVAAWFGGTKERNPDVEIWFSRFINGKWEPGKSVANGIVNDTLRYACWNPVLYQVPNGELQLYYKVGPNVAGWVGKVITSNDGGLTWSQPRDLPEGFLGPIKNKPVLLKDGTLINPSSIEGSGGWRVYFEQSRNFGKTWTKKPIIPNTGENAIHAIQPSILTHRNGDLQILCRTQSRRLGESWSKDNGKTWTPMTLSTLPNTNSGTDAVTLQDGRQLLVYNHVLPHDTMPRGKGERTPLNVAISDDGKTWYAVAVLEDSPISQYSYPSVIQSKDGLVHIIYTWRRKGIKHIVMDPKQFILSEMAGNEVWSSGSETEKVQIFNNQRYKVSACDWMMLKRQKVGAIELSKELGADGLELDIGGLGQNVSFQNTMKDKRQRDLFISECNRLGIQFSSLALSAFYGQSFAKRDNYEQLMDETIETMKALGIKVAFLPMGNQSDMVKEPELYPIILERLKVVAKKAEVAGVVIGIETTLSAKEEAKLIDKINSPAIKSYVNFSSILKRNGDIIKDLKTLGKDRIIQIHATNTDGHWIENDPALDMEKIKATLDKMGWSGWLVIERSRDTSDVHNVKRNYGANVKYLKSIFQ